MFGKTGILKIVDNEFIYKEVHKNSAEFFRFIEELPNVIEDLFITTFRDIESRMPINWQTDPPQSQRQVLAILLLVKALNTIESMVILMEKGLESDLRVLCRSLFETVIRLRAMCQDPEYHKEYIGYDLHERMMFFRVIDRHEDFFIQTHSRDIAYSSGDAIAKVDSIKKNITENKLANKGKTVDIAKKVDMEKEYDFVYRHFSIDAHATPKSLERLFQRDEGVITQINAKSANFDKMEIIMCTGLTYLLRAMEDLCNLLGQENQTFIHYSQRFMNYFKCKSDSTQDED